MCNLPLELIDLIYAKINREILANICNSTKDIQIIENFPFFSLNEKRLQKYWKNFNIFEMIKIGDLAGVKYLISINKDKKWPYYLLCTLPIFISNLSKMDIGINRNMWLACFYGHLNIVKYLISLGAHIKAQNDLALKCACKNGNLEIVKYLISLGADILAENNDPIVDAIANGHLILTKYLISLGADPLAQNNLGIAWASENGHLEMIKYLVSLGADISGHNYSGIVFAENLEILKYFVSIGIDILPHAERIISHAYVLGNHDIVQYIKNLE